MSRFVDLECKGGVSDDSDWEDVHSVSHQRVYTQEAQGSDDDSGETPTPSYPEDDLKHDTPPRTRKRKKSGKDEASQPVPKKSRG